MLDIRISSNPGVLGVTIANPAIPKLPATAGVRGIPGPPLDARRGAPLY